MKPRDTAAKAAQDAQTAQTANTARGDRRKALRHVRRVLASTATAADTPEKKHRRYSTRPQFDSRHLATLCGLTPNYINRVMRAAFPPTLLRASVIAQALTTLTGEEWDIHRLAYMLGWAPTPPPPEPYRVIVVWKLKQNSLIPTLGVNKGWMSKLVRGEGCPSLGKAVKLAEHFECSVDHLVKVFGWLSGEAPGYYLHPRAQTKRARKLVRLET